MGILASPFARKLLAALIGTVLLLAIGVGWAVRRETATQVVEVSERAFAQAEVSLRAFEGIRLQILFERMAPFLETPRSQAALLEMTDTSAVTLIRELDYLRERSEVGELLLGIHDPEGAPLFVAVMGDDGRREFDGSDPLELTRLTDQAYESEFGRARGYRRIGDRIFRSESVVVVRESGFVAGFYTLGSPIDEADVREIGRMTGVELCFVSGDTCLAGTERATGELAGVFASAELSSGAGTSRDGEGAAGGTLAVGHGRMMGMHRADNGSRWEVLESGLALEGDLRLAYAVPLEPVLAPFDQILQALLVGGLLSLLLTGVAAGLIARRMTAPVLRLTAATESIGAGDYGTRVRVTSNDEIGELGRAFNGMAEELALKERYRGVLDKVVAPEIARELLAGDVVLGGEARDVTVLFGDLRGFTELTGEMEPEAVIEMLNEYMARLAAEVDRAGGVVDKFVGDEIMAIFGAPVAHADDAVRAVGAARAMQQGMDELNRTRTERGEPVLGLGIGINSGRVVAGNMGSPDRLNYTVLGTTVNLAARLCSSADAGEILLGEHAAAAVGEAPGTVDPIGARKFKGVSRPMEVFRAAWSSTAILVALILASGIGAGAVDAQDWPSIRDRAYWTNADGSVQAGLSGRLEIDGYLPGADGAGLLPPGSVLAPRLRLFADFFVGDEFQLVVEGRADRGDIPGSSNGDLRVERAFVRLGGGRIPVALTLGKFPSPVGGYSARHLGPDDPFIRPPFPYDYRTVMCPILIPASLGTFLSWREDPETFRTIGAPPLWQVPYPWGGRLDFGTGDTGVHVSWLNSAPSSGPSAWAWSGESLRNPTISVGARTRIGPELRLSAWWSKGPWLAVSQLGPDLSIDPWAWDQELFGFEAEWRRGGTLARAELWLDRWEVPGTGNVDFRDIPWSVMMQQDLQPGLWVAGRLGGVQFVDAQLPGGGSAPWDDSVLRAELAAGLRLARNAGVRASLSQTATFGGAVPDPDDGLFAVQLWWEF